jgi:predicted transcriptional regulator
MKKAQLSIYLDPEIFRSLEAFAMRHGRPKSLVAEAAIASFLSPDDSDRREAAIAKRLDRIVRVLERLERNDRITLETIALCQHRPLGTCRLSGQQERAGSVDLVRR